ncbi:MAG: hypothetical protein M0D55_19290 [Elusimicrobiota bacterium]|nr:MAG: hypothetical protein M0D55_19290 [Elusimicrobiota bacterium]
MIRAIALTVALTCAAASAAAQDGSVMSGALIEALAAIDKPELGGVFAYVGRRTPRARSPTCSRATRSR